jgi:hypothetical protein
MTVVTNGGYSPAIATDGAAVFIAWRDANTTHALVYGANDQIDDAPQL